MDDVSDDAATRQCMTCMTMTCMTMTCMMMTCMMMMLQDNVGTCQWRDMPTRKTKQMIMYYTHITPITDKYYTCKLVLHVNIQSPESHRVGHQGDTTRALAGPPPHVGRKVPQASQCMTTERDGGGRAGGGRERERERGRLDCGWGLRIGQRTKN